MALKGATRENERRKKTRHAIGAGPRVADVWCPAVHRRRAAAALRYFINTSANYSPCRDFPRFPEALVQRQCVRGSGGGIPLVVADPDGNLSLGFTIGAVRRRGGERAWSRDSADCCSCSLRFFLAERLTFAF